MLRGVARGFSAIELVVAMGLALAVVAAAFSALRGSPDRFAVQQEASDMQQRVRIAADVLQRSLASAVAVRPNRFGTSAPDPPGTFRSDTITAIGATTSTVFWLRRDSSGTWQLASNDGAASPDVPVVDHVVQLAFSYWGSDGQPIPPAALGDGPWLPDDASESRRDADLDRVRVVEIAIRVQSALASLRGPAGPLFTYAGTAVSGSRLAPDIAVRLKVAPRGLNLAN